ncbi:hypothetical protein N185_08470 [Sinorhizobium sp. GW3]|nr:hypothetical protein N185_08470 [Sinorhizobium sp. GW3]
MTITEALGINEVNNGVMAKYVERNRRGEQYALQFIGPFDRILGLGESSRRLMTAVRAGEDSCNFVCCSDGIQSVAITGDYNFQISRSKINIIHLNAEQIPEFFLKSGDIIRESYNIIFPYWELDKLSSLHMLGLSLIDEVWTASNFISSVFLGQGLPVFTVGLPAVKLAGVRAFNRQRAGRFTFLTSFDAFSWPQRKNAVAVVEAFLAAFRGDENVQLIVKTQNADFVHTRNQLEAWRELQQRTAGDDRIEVINETYSPARQKQLLASCDCFVSLHRSEGLGIDILDALASGIPVVATAYSGNMDVCTARNTWLVDYKLVPVGKDDYVFVESGHLWAHPEHSSAVGALRGVYENDALREEKSRIGVMDAEARRSVTAVTENVFKRLNVIRSLKDLE